LRERAEINIYDIPIADLTDQYMEAIKDLPMDMESTSEFVLMAATLLEIKSRMLLPKPPKPEENEEDPRDALVRRLLEYKHCQEIAGRLQLFPSPGQRLKRDGETDLIDRFAIPEQSFVLDDVDLSLLWQLFNDVINRRESRIDVVRADYGDMPRERFTVTEKIARLQDYLQTHGRFYLSQILEECVNRREMVVTFLALLEMIRRGLMQVRQDKMFKEIFCTEA
jgi:segregation and condensation protein A